MTSVFPFVRVEHHTHAEIVGARWWYEGMSAGDPVARRSALIALGAFGALAVGMGACVAMAPSSSSTTSTTSRASLEAQQEYGWNVGAGTADFTTSTAPAVVEVTPNLAGGEPFDRAALARMVDELAPTSLSLAPFYVATLFQSLMATPKNPTNLEPFKPLHEVLVPLFTADMEKAFSRGRAMASLFEGAPGGRAVIVDLPGPLAVAFAAGLADRLDPVFGFDGWPHPQGVVPAHQTLGAAAYYQALFAERRRARPSSAPPAFVLDRARLAAYSDESDRFDNRYMAKVPSAAQLGALGVKQVLHVSQNPNEEADDLNDDFVAYASAGIELRNIADTDFSPEPGSSPGGSGASDTYGPLDAGTRSKGYGYAYHPYYYGGYSARHWYFWPHYGWGQPARPYSTFTSPILRGSYRPSYRTTPFTGSGTGMSKSRPPSYGSVGIVSSSGRTVGTTRSGSWGRTGSGSSSSGG